MLLEYKKNDMNYMNIFLVIHYFKKFKFKKKTDIVSCAQQQQQPRCRWLCPCGVIAPPLSPLLLLSGPLLCLLCYELQQASAADLPILHVLCLGKFINNSNFIMIFLIFSEIFTKYSKTIICPISYFFLPFFRF